MSIKSLVKKYEAQYKTLGVVETIIKQAGKDKQYTTKVSGESVLRLKIFTWQW